MKKIFLAFLAMACMIPTEGHTKYKQSEGVPTQIERDVNRRFRNYGKEEEGVLTLEEYQEFRQVRTREDRRQERQARKKGTYVSPEDAFKAMDEDKNGKVTAEEMLKYEQGKLKLKLMKPCLIRQGFFV